MGKSAGESAYSASAVWEGLGRKECGISAHSAVWEGLERWGRVW